MAMRILVTCWVACGLIGCSLGNDLDAPSSMMSADTGASLADVSGGDAEGVGQGTEDASVSEGGSDGGGTDATEDVPEEDVPEEDVPVVEACSCDEKSVCLDEVCRPGHEGLIRDAPPMLGELTGGAFGSECVVTEAGISGPGTLAWCLERPRPLWVFLDEELPEEVPIGTVAVGSDVTIDGRGAGYHALIGQLVVADASNVILHNLALRGEGVRVGLELDGADAVWATSVTIANHVHAVWVRGATGDIGFSSVRLESLEAVLDIDGVLGETPEASTRVFIDGFSMPGVVSMLHLGAGYQFLANGRVDGGGAQNTIVVLGSKARLGLAGVNFGSDGGVVVAPSAAVRARSVFLDPDMAPIGDQAPELVPDYPGEGAYCASEAACNWLASEAGYDPFAGLPGQ